MAPGSKMSGSQARLQGFLLNLNYVSVGDPFEAEKVRSLRSLSALHQPEETFPKSLSHMLIRDHIYLFVFDCLLIYLLDCY